MVQNKYESAKIGTVIAIFSLVLSSTYIVPILTNMPIGLPLELIFSEIFKNSSYRVIAAGVLFSLITIFIVVGLYYLKQIQEDKKAENGFNKQKLILFFISQIFIIHPLVFYIWATINAHRASDGQFFFGIVETFPLSSFIFPVLGWGIDKIKNTELRDIND